MDYNGMLPIIIFASVVICGSISGRLAYWKGHNPISWFFAGLLFGIFGLLGAVGLPVIKLPEIKE